ncbi:MAG: 50S ribosomal protein L10 [Candidatus Methanomethyliaceae archaeon]|nr:50S ribosomal protein L10 [Candidatus Methanomethyliaceae archaeon]MDW7970668.1 50S ribosomal protein L10 [Nitrososphaerota archaeon]
MARASLEIKKSIVEKIVLLFQKYHTFAIGNLYGMKAKHIQSIRKNFRGLIEVYVAKNTLIKKAMERVPKFNGYREEISKYLSGQNILIFSNMNPFSLYLLLEKNKIASEAAPGDIATEDIIVPAGNTGLQPGPILSKFGAAKIPTKIQEGSIWIVKDTLVAKKGDVISADLADILKKLGLKPIMVSLKLKMAFDETVIPGEVLAIDLDKYKSEIKSATEYAINLAFNIAYPTKETVPLLISKAYMEARTLAIVSALPIPEILKDSVTIAILRGRRLFEEITKKYPEVVQEK